jgi:hypothetical protein
MVVFERRRQCGNVAFQTGLEFFQGNDQALLLRKRDDSCIVLMRRFHGQALCKEVLIPVEPGLSAEGANNVGQALANQVTNLQAGYFVTQGILK